MSTLRFGVLLIAIFSASFVQAQQLPLFTQYREHASAINPASISSNYMAFDQNGVFGFSYRSQWMDIPNSPKTTVLHGSYFLDDQSGVNFLLGGNLLNDQTGPTGFTGFYARAAGVISSDPAYGGISIGLTAGMVQYSVKAAELRAKQPGDIRLTQNQSQMYPDVGVGIFAYQQLSGALDGDFVYGGFSVPQVFGIDFSVLGDDGEEFLTKRTQHFYAQAGWIKYFWNDSFLEPSVWVKYVPGAPISVDVNLRYQFAGALWIGAGGSTAKAAHLEGGVFLGDNLGYESNLQIGYGYDYFFQAFGPFTGGSHEINLAYYFSR
ncbi:MAG: PorP/SprF family type IX secretion system membrane protein [Bacteroidota bacterium]